MGGSIPDAKPRWETLKAANETEQKLLREREDLHEFQKKVEDARHAADKDGVTTKELDDLGADLEREMPDAVRQRLPGHEATPPALADAPASGVGQARQPVNLGAGLSR